MNARSLLYGDDGRLHALWRILLFLLLCVSSVVVVTIALAPILRAAQEATGIAGIASAYGIAIALLLAHWMTLRTFDQRDYAFVGLDREAARPKVLAYGWVLGAAPMVFVALVLFAAGWLRVVPGLPGSWWKAAVQVSVVLLPAALYEELLCRGYVFVALREWVGTAATVALTSIVFGLLHVTNPGSDPLAIVLVTLAGVYLAAVFLATRSMYAVWMAHWAWNWVMGVALHIPVSGLPFENPDYKTVETGPDWATGGAWGPEGGAVAAVGMLGGIGYLYWRNTRRRDESATIER